MTPSSPDQSSPVSIVGPFNLHELVVHGYTVPSIQAKEEDGGTILFLVDHRLGYSVSAGEFEQVACLVADAYAIGLGLASAPRADKHPEDWREALSRVPILMRPRQMHEIVSVSTEEVEDV